MKKSLWLILAALGFFSLSRGLWCNYQSLWLEQNGLSISTISTVTSLSSLASVSIMLLLFDVITKKRLKGFLCILLLAKIIVLCSLFLLNGTHYFLVMKFLIMLNIILDTEFIVSIYPLLVLIQKDDGLYCKKDLVISTCYDLGILFGGLFLGGTLFQLEITFNIFLLFSICCTILAFLILRLIQIDIPRGDQENHHIFDEIFRLIRKDNVSKSYLKYVFFGNVPFYIITGITMLLLTKTIHFTVTESSWYLVSISILSDVVGILILKYFTSKNNTVNVFIKVGGRILTALFAFLLPNIYTYLLVITYTLFFGNSYSHVLDAPYINRFQNDYQLAFSNIRNILAYAASFVGIFLCGLFLTQGTRYMFLILMFFLVIQFYYAMKMYKQYQQQPAILVVEN